MRGLACWLQNNPPSKRKHQIYFRLKLLLDNTTVTTLFLDVCIMQVLTMLNIRSVVFSELEPVIKRSHGRLAVQLPAWWWIIIRLIYCNVLVSAVIGCSICLGIMLMLLSFATRRARVIYSTAACAYTMTHFIYHSDNGHVWLLYECNMCVCVFSEESNRGTQGTCSEYLYIVPIQ